MGLRASGKRADTRCMAKSEGPVFSGGASFLRPNQSAPISALRPFGNTEEAGRLHNRRGPEKNTFSTIKGGRDITKRTLLELVEALEIPPPEMSGGTPGLDADALFRALLRKEGLTACQDKLVRWARDLYGAEADL